MRLHTWSAYVASALVIVQTTLASAQDSLKTETIADIAGEEAASPSDILSNASNDITVNAAAEQSSVPVYFSSDDGRNREELASAMKGAYGGVFYANRFAYLNAPSYDGPYFLGDSFKGLVDNRLDLGGELRTRYHNENNMRGLGLTGKDDQFWLTRLRLFANYRVTENVRFFAEYLYADSAGETFGPGAGQRPIEENRGEAQNLFFDVKLLDNGDSKLSTRLGRQELLFGAQRLVSPLDWANTRRTFDGYRMTHSSDSNSLDVFYTNPVSRVFATAGTNQWDSSDSNQHLYGVHNSWKGSEAGVWDAYYIAYDNDTTNFSFHTIGSRLAGKTEHFMYELEGGVQFGENSNGSDHSAGFATAGIGKQLNVNDSWKPTAWVWYDWASGGDSPPLTEGDNGFHHYFPLAHKYNGFMDLFGRRNLNDANVQLITPLGKKVKFLLWYHYFFLDEATSPYSVVMTPFNAAGGAVSKDLGHEIDCLFTVDINERNSMLFGYSFFDAGNYFDTPGSPTRADADFFYWQCQSRF